jgi:hypothetical protein
MMAGKEAEWPLARSREMVSGIDVRSRCTKNSCFRGYEKN